MDEKITKIVLFQDKKIRKQIHKNEWYFSVVDIVESLTDSKNATDYLKKLRKRDIEVGLYIGTNCPQVEMETESGKKRKTLAGNVEQLFRIIQSIPSPKAEPIKRWLAKTGFERVQEIENPELATKRTRFLYKAKGYSDDWIGKRMRGIAIREELTDEWQKRGAREQRDYEILTAEISKATFGVTPDEYKKFKGLKRENLRDHMDDFELIFTMLGERSKTEIHRVEDSKGTAKLKADAKAGGDIAGGARKNLEKRLGKSVVSKYNYLKSPQDKKLLK
ncbi:MAG: hypothetical protein US63_C0026G0003 [Candidatus Moranbacteria bacterium GW2011_GWC2_37_8]|nr:MAG: hypothetical protein US63_C0026G0003 [Candidatus Moranbacteria bacterium GW2011_GWC2_37_8]KKQ62886.1 MAG: hypothetical protein US82_C0004G0003 [Parcubacteria group bacterium GW2011_GWC1_38_22]